MIAFHIPAGTPARAIRADQEWYPRNIRQIETKNDHTFYLEDVVIDPLGKVGTGPDSHTIGGHYASRGWHGFHSHEGHDHATDVSRRVCRKGWILLVMADYIDTR